MSNITSVSTAQVKPNNTIPYLLIATGAIIFLGGVGLLLMEGFSSALGLLLVGGAALGGGIYWMRSRKPSYIVRIGSASGKTDALGSQDEAWIKKIVNAMNEAIVQRG